MPTNDKENWTQAQTDTPFSFPFAACKPAAELLEVAVARSIKWNRWDSHERQRTRQAKTQSTHNTREEEEGRENTINNNKQKKNPKQS